jgi:predicted N-acetyltransferase YhbS
MTLESELHFRLANKDDVPALRYLVNSAYSQLAELGLNFTGAYQDEQITRERMQGKDVYLAFLGDELVATISLGVEQKDEGPVLYLNQIAVAPAHQRKGIGGILLRLAEERAAIAGVAALQLDTAVPATHLVTMYGKAGYRVIKEVHWPGKTYNSYIMHKQLGSGEAPDWCSVSPDYHGRSQ